MNTSVVQTGAEPVPPCPWCGRVTSDVDYKACRTGSDAGALVVHVLIRADCDNAHCPGPAGGGDATGPQGPVADRGQRIRRAG